jgi:hypothetical protein
MEFILWYNISMKAKLIQDINIAILPLLLFLAEAFRIQEPFKLVGPQQPSLHPIAA